jgi:hypothetical protein
MAEEERAMVGDGIGWLAEDYPDGFCVTFTRGLDEAPAWPGWAFTIETASFEGGRPEVLRRLSAGTTALCVHSDIEGAAGSFPGNGVIQPGRGTFRPD